MLARHGGGRWYVAGINAETSPRDLKLDLSELGAKGAGVLINDGESGENLSFQRETISVPANQQVEITLAPRGGFVMILD